MVIYQNNLQFAKWKNKSDEMLDMFWKEFIITISFSKIYNFRLYLDAVIRCLLRKTS